MMSKEILFILSTILLNSTVVIYGFIFHDAYEWLQLNKSCESDLDCLELSFAKCNVNKMCQCIDRFVALQGKRCAPVVGGYCTKNYDCFINNSHCVDRACKCKPKYTPQSEECVPSVLREDCYRDSDCSFNHNTECSDKKECICKKNYAVVDQSTCLPLLGSHCRNGERCFAKNSICENNKCRCKDHFISVSNYECVLSFLGKKCDSDNDCSEIRLAQCSKNKKCSCKTEKISVDHRICLQVLGEVCKRNDDCAPKHAECTNKKCRCMEGYVPISDYECLEQWKYSLYRDG